MGLYTGQRLKNYVINDQIACGGMGEIWRAWDDVHGEYVAIKAIADNLFVDPNFTNRFLDEGRRHLWLTHPNIVPVLDVFYADNQNCLVLKLIDGKSLADILQSRQEHLLSVSEAMPILQGLLSGLNYAHLHGVIHRDVKPSNVLIDKNGQSYLIDFGIALAIGEDRRTRTGQTIGTPHYMSPEQIVTPKEIDHRSDVYSVGCVFYEMLTGRPPFIADAVTGEGTDFSIKKAHVNIEPLPPAERVNTIPTYINDIIMYALQKKPENRLPGCQEFLRLLREGDTKQVTKKSRFHWVYFFSLLLAILWLIVISSLFKK
jgi:serine/threonine-protein kinase